MEDLNVDVNQLVRDVEGRPRYQSTPEIVAEFVTENGESKLDRQNARRLIRDLDGFRKRGSFSCNLDDKLEEALCRPCFTDYRLDRTDSYLKQLDENWQSADEYRDVNVVTRQNVLLTIATLPFSNPYFSERLVLRAERYDGRLFVRRMIPADQMERELNETRENRIYMHYTTTSCVTHASRSPAQTRDDDYLLDYQLQQLSKLELPSIDDDDKPPIRVVYQAQTDCLDSRGRRVKVRVCDKQNYRGDVRNANQTFLCSIDRYTVLYRGGSKPWHQGYPPNEVFCFESIDAERIARDAETAPPGRRNLYSIQRSLHFVATVFDRMRRILECHPDGTPLIVLHDKNTKRFSFHLSDSVENGHPELEEFFSDENRALPSRLQVVYGLVDEDSE